MSSDPRPRQEPRARWLDNAAERVWQVGFGILARSAPRLERVEWPSGERVRILVTAPHPDDEALGCGGAIALHSRAGNDVTVVIVTDGGLSNAASPADRAREASAAADVLGGSWQWLGLREGNWLIDEAAGRLEAVLEKVRPTLVYAPSIVDYHPEHVRVAAALARAFSRTEARTARVRVFEVGVPLTPVLANRYADIAAASTRKARALAAYKSQRSTITAVERLHRYNRRM
jgi:LmbE family N-acetylglucosaminyl deacetylase